MINSIQILRAIAAIMVVMYHITIKAEQYNNESFTWFHIGEYGVDLFFIISGFIMCYTTATRQVTFSRFMRDRIKRIIPLYWVMTTVALAVYLVAPSIVNSSGGETSIFASYTLIPNGDKLLVQNGWTLSYEFLYYFIFAGCLAAAASGRNLLYTSVCILLIAAVGFITRPENPTLAFLTHIVLVEFVLGILAFKLLYNKKMSLPVSTLLLVIGIAMLVAQNQFGKFPSPFGRLVCGGVPMFFVFVGFVGMERYIAAAQFRFKKALLLLGDASYSIYLIHAFTLSASAKVVKAVHLEKYDWIFSSVLLLSSIVAGVIAYWYVERPINLYFKRRKMKAVAASGAA